MGRDWKRFKQQQAGLRIRKAELSDSGLYQCQAINGYGTGQMIHIQLQIAGTTKFYTPLITAIGSVF